MHHLAARALRARGLPGRLLPARAAAGVTRGARGPRPLRAGAGAGAGGRGWAAAVGERGGSGGGRVEVLCGPMFSGKTTELLRRMSAARAEGVNVALVGPCPPYTCLRCRPPPPSPRRALVPPPDFPANPLGGLRWAKRALWGCRTEGGIVAGHSGGARKGSGAHWAVGGLRGGGATSGPRNPTW